MSDENPYETPSSEQSGINLNEDLIAYRKSLVPTWMRVFGWLFLVFGLLVPIMELTAAATGTDGEFSLYGLEFVGSVISPLPLFILALFAAHGICAYGLLFGKQWGVASCIVLGYLSALICVLTTIFGDGFNIRLELLVLIPYLMKLHKIKWDWTESAS